MNSAEQDQWSDICAAARAQLGKFVEMMPAMKVEEVGALMNAIDTAMWNEVKAASYDEHV